MEIDKKSMFALHFDYQPAFHSHFADVPDSDLAFL